MCMCVTITIVINMTQYFPGNYTLHVHTQEALSAFPKQYVMNL